MHERDPQALLTIYRESLLGIYASEDEFSLYLFLFFSIFLFFFYPSNNKFQIKIHFPFLQL